MALTVKGTALKFGIGGAGLTAPAGGGAADISCVQSAEVTDEFGVNATARDAGGETVSHVYGDTKHTTRVEGYHTAAAIPTLGGVLTVGGKETAIMRATIGASNEDFVKLSMEGEGWNSIDYGT